MTETAYRNRVDLRPDLRRSRIWARTNARLSSVKLLAGPLFALIAAPISAQTIDETFAECARFAATKTGFADVPRTIDQIEPSISYIERETDLGLVTIKLFSEAPQCHVMGIRFAPDHRHTTIGFLANEAALTSWVIAQAQHSRHARVYEGLGAQTVICDGTTFIQQVAVSSAGSDDEERSFLFSANSAPQASRVCE